MTTTITSYLIQYGPWLALATWFGYRWWSARRVADRLPALRLAGAMLIDVRSPQEFAQGHAPECINIPLPELGARLGDIPRSRPLVLCCASGSRSAMARLQLRRHGYTEVHNIGAWTRLLD